MARSDDELAFVIAHEMAHNILGHLSSSGRDSRALFGLLFASGGPTSAESQADAAAVSLMDKGGYAPEAGMSFLQSAKRRMWWAMSFDHPSFGSRIRTVAQAIARDRLYSAATQRRASAAPQLPNKAVI
jgi:predicted Zn-dependent protease